MNSRSCQRGMPEWAAGLSRRRDRKNEVDMMSKVQPSLRAIATALGTVGISMNAHPLGRIDARRGRRLHGQDDVLLVQHLVVLEAVHERGRGAVGIAGQEYG